MQSTEAGQGAASGAVVQRDPDGAFVVVACDRCDDEVRTETQHNLSDAVVERARRYATLNIGTMVSQSKVLRLCPECVRAFRLFMLGASSSSVRVAEKWESIVCGAV